MCYIKCEEEGAYGKVAEEITLFKNIMFKSSLHQSNKIKSVVNILIGGRKLILILCGWFFFAVWCG
jgi:hypothetical protein